ncbi:MAG: nucleotidyltransferase family protein [Proteobacteria bacterium]|nr:nucleotidyltransferase family protein [Pseudomonadota bacterium]
MKQDKRSESTVKAFLLVAGRGERLKPLTETVPKCLLPINGKPLLEIWLEHLQRSGIHDVLINTHWLHEKIEEFVANWSVFHKKMRIILFHEPVLLGSAGTLLANRQWAGEGPFFIIYGDNLTNFDLQRMLAFHYESGLPLTLRVYKGADPQRAGIVSVNEAGVITTFEEKPVKPKSDLGAGGIYVADGRFFDFFPKPHHSPEAGLLDLSYHVLPRMVGAMQAYESGEFSMDIGTPKSYEAAQREWRKLHSC